MTPAEKRIHDAVDLFMAQERRDSRRTGRNVRQSALRLGITYDVLLSRQLHPGEYRWQEIESIAKATGTTAEKLIGGNA